MNFSFSTGLSLAVMRFLCLAVLQSASTKRVNASVSSLLVNRNQGNLRVVSVLMMESSFAPVAFFIRLALLAISLLRLSRVLSVNPSMGISITNLSESSSSKPRSASSALRLSINSRSKLLPAKRVPSRSTVNSPIS